VGALAAALALTGCATFAARPGEGDAAREGRIVRPGAPPEYDVLVAQQLVLEGRNEEALEAWLRAVQKDEDSAWLQRRAALALAQHNRLDEALARAERAVELEPGDADSRIFLAQLYRLRREPEAAQAVLLAASGEPSSPDAAFLLYQIHLEADRNEEALEVARWLSEAEPDSLRGHVAVANAHQRMGRPEEAERALRSALAKDPGNLRLYGALARLLRERGAHRDELKLYDEILDLYPHHHATLVALGEARLALEDNEGAIAVFSEVEQRYPEDVDSVVRLGYLLFEARRFDEAEERFTRALAANAEDYQVAFFLGVVKRRRGDTEGALALFQTLPPEDRFYPDARTQAASIFERRGLYAEALAEVELANQARPDRDLDLYAATLQAKAGQLDQAVARIQGMLAAEPESDELLFNLGVVYGEAKRTDEAISYMQRALEKNPDNASALNYIGYSWAEQGVKLDEAERMITRAIELRPDDGYIVDSLGWVYYMRALPLVESGRAREAQPYIHRAMRELERAHELTGGDPVISEHMGDLYLLLDQKRRALEKFEEAIRLEPREGEQPHLLRKFESLQRELR
jgi:tetratricopeptide (TPR) repeat protein